MKLGPVTKLNKTPQRQKIGDDIMSTNILVKFLTYDQFGAIWKLDSRRMVCKT